MPIERSLGGELERGLRELESRSQRRSLSEIAGVNLCSNDYLGLAEDPRLREAVLEAVRVAPRVGGTGSRLLSGHLRVWDEVESEFAEFAGTEAALYFGSGYAANVGLLTAILGKDEVVFSDELNHASLIDGARLSGARKIVYPHLDLNALEGLLRWSDGIGRGGRKFVVTETVFSMDGDVAPVAELAALCERFGASLILDEAHATALHGPGGRGIAAGTLADLEEKKKLNAESPELDSQRSRKRLESGRVFAVVHTCGKALASAGAFVCGSAVLREHLVNHARTFLFSTAMPPYMAGQVRAALRLAMGMGVERVELLERSRRLAAGLRVAGYDTAGCASQIVPVVVGENKEALALAECLQGHGFAVKAIRPPTVKAGQARVRLSITAAIADGDLKRLENSLGSWRVQRAALAAAGCA
jgi:8-amino-7-oxononanoate synthase